LSCRIKSDPHLHKRAVFRGAEDVEDRVKHSSTVDALPNEHWWEPNRTVAKEAAYVMKRNVELKKSLLSKQAHSKLQGAVRQCRTTNLELFTVATLMNMFVLNASMASQQCIFEDCFRQVHQCIFENLLQASASPFAVYSYGCFGSCAGKVQAYHTPPTKDKGDPGEFYDTKKITIWQSGKTPTPLPEVRMSVMEDPLLSKEVCFHVIFVS
jgi:hypothetical protein